MQVIDISELTPQAQELLSKMKAGEELTIVADNQPIAKVIPISDQPVGQRKRRQAGLSNSVAWMSPDFNEPLEDFKEYME